MRKLLKLCALAIVAAAVIALACPAAGGGTPSGQPSPPTPAARRPAPPAGAAVRPEAQAEQIAKTWSQRLGEGYEIQTDIERRLVFLSALDKSHFEQTRQLLADFTDAARKSVFSQPLAWNVTIVLPTAEDYKKLSPPASAAGFYRQADHALISLDRQRILLHEFTHALHHADAATFGQHHPVWLCEGLAGLLESAEIADDGLSPKTDARLPALQEALRTDKAMPLEKLFALPPEQFAQDARPCYAQARYAMLYLHQKGKLRDFYEAYKADYADDPSAGKTYAKVLDKDPDDVQKDWAGWVRQLQFTQDARRAEQGRLGLEFQDCPDGVRVVGLAAGGAAQQAGRIQVGDLIRTFNGRLIRNSGELVGAIRAAGANQTVTVDVLRHGQPVTLRQPLAAPR